MLTILAIKFNNKYLIIIYLLDVIYKFNSTKVTGKSGCMQIKPAWLNKIFYEFIIN